MTSSLCDCLLICVFIRLQCFSCQVINSCASPSVLSAFSLSYWRLLYFLTSAKNLLAHSSSSSSLKMTLPLWKRLFSIYTPQRLFRQRTRCSFSLPSLFLKIVFLLNWPLFSLSSPLLDSIFSFCSVCLNSSPQLGDGKRHFEMWALLGPSLSNYLSAMDFCPVSCHLCQHIN